MNNVLIVTIIVFGILGILFLARVLLKKRLLKELGDEAADNAFKFGEMLKMAYPALLIYALLYVLFLIALMIYYSGEGSLEGIRAAIESPYKGLNATDWMPTLFGIYLDIWVALHIIDMDCRSRNNPFMLFFRTVNTNTGVAKWNIMLLIVSIATLIASYTTLSTTHSYFIGLPLFAAATISMIVNLIVGPNDDWYVKKPSQIKWESHDKDGKVKIKAGSQDLANNGKTPVERTFKWILKDKWGIATDPSDIVKITFYKEDWEEPDPEMRKKNPFYGVSDDGKTFNWLNMASDLSKSIPVVLQGPDNNDNDTEQRAIDTILQSAFDIADKYNMADFEIPELILTFCQSDEIKYVVDEKSVAINRFNSTNTDGDPALEYFRFASETLYDKEGDCDCKSVLAYRLMNAMGIDVKLVSVCTNGSAVPTHIAIIFKDDTNRYRKLAQYPDYTYCEATSNGWKIGDIPEIVDEKTIKILA